MKKMKSGSALRRVTKARLYRETLIRESGGNPTAFENEEEYAPIWNPRTGRLIARIYKRQIVAELNTPDYQINISDAMNGMSPSEMCAIKSLIKFGCSEKQHQRAMERAGPADRARLVLERRQLTDCVQEQLKLISPDSGSNISNAFARIQWDTSQGTSSTDKTPEDSISNCPQGSVIEGGNRMLLPEREQDFKRERSNYTSEQMQVIRYYQQQANRLDDELQKTMEPDISDEET